MLTIPMLLDCLFSFKSKQSSNRKNINKLYFDQLPDELIEMICKYILNPNDLMNIRLVSVVFCKSISTIRLKIELVKNMLSNLKKLQFARHINIRPYCVNIDCRSPIFKTKCVGNIFLFHKNTVTSKKSNDSSFKWLYHDSFNKHEYWHRQKALRNTVINLQSKGEGDFNCIYLPYCINCASVFIIKKLPPYNK